MSPDPTAPDTAPDDATDATGTAPVPESDGDQSTVEYCTVCGIEFTALPRGRHRSYCSPDCRRQASRLAPTPVTRTCPVCQGEFTAHPSVRQVYCSPDCRTQANRSQPSYEARTCPICQDEFVADRRQRQIYCAHECRREADRRRERERNEQRARRLGVNPRPQPAAKTPADTGPPRPAPRHDGRGPLAPAATRNCPHCDQPITIVALLATPEAARPAIPGRVPDITPLRRIP